MSKSRDRFWNSVAMWAFWIGSVYLAAERHFPELVVLIILATVLSLVYRSLMRIEDRLGTADPAEDRPES